MNPGTIPGFSYTTKWSITLHFRFKNILIDNGELILKTDNRLLFEYSLVSFQNYGLHFEDVCLDLHHSEGYEDNIQTEYERKFSPFGPIYQVKTTFKGVNKNG